ncbi:MAG: HEAT repeat domain-containing protein [Armatimonadota bacterium]
MNNVVSNPPNAARRPRTRRLLEAAVVLLLIVGLGIWAHRRSAALVDEQIALLASDDIKHADAAQGELARMGRRAVKPLIKALREAPPGPTQDRIARTLGRIGDLRAADALTEAAERGSVQAAWSLRGLGVPGAYRVFATAHCVRGEQLLAKAQRAVPVADSLSAALEATANGSDWGFAPLSVATTLRQAQDLFALAMQTHPTERAVRGLLRIYESYPRVDRQRPTDALHDRALAAIVADWHAATAREAAVCRALAGSDSGAIVSPRTLTLHIAGQQPLPVAVWLQLEPGADDATEGRGRVVACAYEDHATGGPASLGLRQTVGSWHEQWIRSVGLWVGAKDLDGDGAQELLVCREEDSTGRLIPAGPPEWRDTFRLTVFGAEGRRLRAWFAGSSILPPVAADLDGDGTKEITLFEHRYYGDPSAEDVALWPTVYAISDGQYATSDGAYPDLFREILPRWQRAVEANPSSFRAHERLGTIYAAIGRKQEAVRAQAELDEEEATATP